MKSKAEIEAALQALKTEDLHHIECEIHRLYRHRGDRVLYDDAYGVWLEDDQISAAGEVFGLIEVGEAKDGRSQAR